MVRAWRRYWANNFSFHLVQLPSFNMTEEWVYRDPDDTRRFLGDIRVSQAGTAADLRGVSSSVTIDLADLRSPFGSVHNRQKAVVAHRLVLNALSLGCEGRQPPALSSPHRFACINLGTQCALDLTGPYSKPDCGGKCSSTANLVPIDHAINTRPVVSGVAASHHNTAVVTVTIHTGVAGAGLFSSALDCTACCSESAFEASVGGRVWTRVQGGDPVDLGQNTVAIQLESTAFLHATLLRFAYDDLVQCPYFDADGLPLAPFRMPIGSAAGRGQLAESGGACTGWNHTRALVLHGNDIGEVGLRGNATVDEAIATCAVACCKTGPTCQAWVTGPADGDGGNCKRKGLPCCYLKNAAARNSTRFRLADKLAAYGIRPQLPGEGAL